MDLLNNLKNLQLFDTYARLLTNKQRNCLNDYLVENLTLSEISQNYGISRQAVNFNIKESIKLLNVYEEKLGICKKYDTINSILREKQIDKEVAESIISILKE